MKLWERQQCFTELNNERTALIEEQNSLHPIAEVRQWHIKNSRDRNIFWEVWLKVTANEHAPTDVTVKIEETECVVDEEQ